MGDHSVLLVDRLLTESTLEAVIESENPLLATEDIMSDDLSQNLERNICSLKGNTVECRICHDEDEECNMEIPCSCCGSLKYAHRRCIQRWCNEKGDTICEICHQEMAIRSLIDVVVFGRLQQFKPGYTAPPPLFHCGGISVNFRGNWEISRRDLHNPQFIEVATDPNFLGTNFENYSPPSSTSLICCRVIAIIDSHVSQSSSDEENEHQERQPLGHHIHVR
ncbi:Protein of unknown function DUF3675 [Dillenia turbinata]|uniref:RING-CH-type domain-containing protein n=1 Tax=Dillenia turbinata TaxID=194707 RepID=A0AAN8VEL9_9MAGN